jgi:hypothetical protein
MELDDRAKNNATTRNRLFFLNFGRGRLKQTTE